MAEDPRARAGLRSPSSEPGRDRWRGARIAGLLALSAVGAELLAAYGDSTGDPGKIAFLVVFFGALYGAPALLARDLIRRAGWGWPSLLLAYAALALVQACLIDQSMFAEDYMGYEGWEETHAATLVPVFGISAFNAYNFLIGHVVFSFAAAVALAEAWAPPRLARAPWLGPAGAALAAAAYLTAAAMIATDPASRSGSAAQLAASAAVAVALLAAAALVGVRGRIDRDAGINGGADRDSATADARRPPPPLWTTLAVAFGLAVVTGFAEETWVGVAIGVGGTAAAGALLIVAGRRWVWSPRHAAAVALGYLLVRGLLAFTYFPLLGEVEPGPKYAHNVVMLLVVAAAGWCALRAPRSSPRPERAEQRA